MKQLVHDVDCGPTLLGRYLLDQPGQPFDEVNRKIHKALGAADRGHSDDHLSNRGVADRHNSIIRQQGLPALP